ncbi:MAG TPA: acyltransferase [Solirubrobacteraceae bacterium]
MTTTRRRLAGLDGVRGLAALFVVVHHIFLRAFPGYPVDRAPFWAGWLIYGRFAVVVFIVLSGFSLALSPAGRGWRLGGVRSFARRRARRILPAYWGALAFSLAVAWLVMPQPGHAAPDAKSVVVNGLLVENLVAAPTPNMSFWSMAVEAQLYLAFPLLLLVVRRWGAVVMVAGVTLLMATVGVAGPRSFVIQSPPDLAALFAIGMATAGIVRSGRSWPWGWLALAAAVPAVATIWWRGSVWTLDHLLWVDLALGPAVACLLAGLATGRPAPLLRLLDARPLRRLGASSYSLYLTHAPIVVVVYDRIVAGRVHQGVPAFVVTVAVAVPLTVVFARLFASIFERPQLRSAEPVRARAIREDRQVPVEAGQADRAQYPPRAADDRQPAAVGAQLAGDVDEHVEAVGVEEADAVEVDPDLGLAGAEDAAQVGAQLARGREVDVAPHIDHHPVADPRAAHRHGARARLPHSAVLARPQ